MQQQQPNPFFYNTPTRGGASGSSSFSQSLPAPAGAEAGGGSSGGDGVARIKAKLDDLDRILLDARHEEGRLVQEQQKTALLEQVGLKATELSRLREELAQTQQRKVVAEERVKANELITHIHETINDALVCAGRKPLGMQDVER